MDSEIRQALEAILFVVDEPVDLTTLSQVLETDRREVRRALEELAVGYEDEGRGFVLREVAGGWRLYTAPQAAPYVERWVVAGRSGRLTQAALETLAVIAYKQPIARQDIGEIRGVNPDAAVRTLVHRGLVEEVGRDDGPGQAILYGTSDLFLEKLGLNSLDQLPPLAEYLPEAPAPDEPAPGDVRAARERLAKGQDLPSTGRGRWDESATAEDDDRASDAATLEDATQAARAAAEARHGAQRARRAARREQDEEMDDLTSALEQAASAAVDQLRSAMDAAEQLDSDDRTDRQDEAQPTGESDEGPSEGAGEEPDGEPVQARSGIEDGGGDA